MVKNNTEIMDSKVKKDDIQRKKLGTKRSKGNDGTGNIEERDDWQTPEWLMEILENQYSINFDCCATEENTKRKHFSKDFLNPTRENIFEINTGRSWMNPPFSKAVEMFKQFFKIVGQGVAIYRCDNMETKLWQEVILKNATWVFIPKGRWAYEGKAGKGSRFPSALIGFNVDVPTGLDGATLILKTTEEKNG